MKIAVFSDTFLPQTNGVATMVFNSTFALSKKGHELIIYTVSEKSSEELTGLANGHFKVVTIPSVYMPAYKGERLALPLGFTVKSIRRFKPDIIHVHTPFGVGLEGILSAKINKIPVVGTHHTFFDHYLKHINLDFSSTRKLSWKATVAFYNKCKIVISPTKSLADGLEQNGLKRELVVLPNMINREFFKAPADKEARNKIKSNFKIEGKSMVYMGRLSYEKSINDVLIVFKEILNKLPNSKLLVVGDGPEKESLVRLSQDFGIEKSVIFTGILRGEELVNSLFAGDLYITMSKSENMPLAVLEAMSVGLPIIAVSSLGMNEIVENNVNGLLLNPEETNKASEKILEVLLDYSRLERLSKKSKEMANNYSEEVVTEKLINLYQSVLKK